MRQIFGVQVYLSMNQYWTKYIFKWNNGMNANKITLMCANFAEILRPSSKIFYDEIANSFKLSHILNMYQSMIDRLNPIFYDKKVVRWKYMYQKRKSKWRSCLLGTSERPAQPGPAHIGMIQDDRYPVYTEVIYLIEMILKELTDRMKILFLKCWLSKVLH